MFIVTLIRDYIDLINQLYDANLGNLDTTQVLYNSLLFIFSSFKVIFLYIVTFQWFRDIIYLPTLVPQLNSLHLKESLIFDLPSYNFFNFLQIPSYSNNKFFIGFLNSIFLSLPVSCSHIISLRRLIVQGKLAGLFSALGTIFGQILFLTLVLFGFRIGVINWFTLEPLNYIIGLFIVFSLCFELGHERAIKYLSNKDTKLLLQVFIINFILSWTEQTCFYQYLGNVTFDSQTTILDSYVSKSQFHFIFIHLSYILGITIGTIFFTVLFGLTIYKITQEISFKLCFILNITYSRWLKYTNRALIVLIIFFSTSSIPYYATEYTFTSSLGFISRDKAYKNTIFDEIQIDIPYKSLGGYSRFKSLDTDVSHYDRGKYLKLPRPQSYEDLNYHGEYFWTSRIDRKNMYRRQRQKGRKMAKALFSHFKNFKFFKKMSYYAQNKDKQNKYVNISNQNINSIENNRKEKIESLNNLFKKQVNAPIGISKRFTRDYELKSPPVGSSLRIMLQNTFSKKFKGNSDKILEKKQRAIERKTKIKYYNNDVYKVLMKTDIDFFLNRKPKVYKLNPNEENELYKKQIILANYFDSLRIYKKLPYSKDFEHLFIGSKSYANRVYNQKFKGTLRVLRRLFSLSLVQKKQIKNKIIFKYDQPLFKKTEKNYIFHEELKYIDNKISPFFEVSNNLPFYLGWDEVLRKLVISNRYLTRDSSGYNIRVSKELKKKSYSKFKNNKIPNRIEFTAWPLPKTVIEDPENKAQKLSYSVFFETINNPFNQKKLLGTFKLNKDITTEWDYETLPKALRKAVAPLIPPGRGGFVWPGKPLSKYNFKNLIKPFIKNDIEESIDEDFVNYGE
uniref:Hypothetical chloroplast RF1 n=1 Tax=Koliella corcontica TaxID=155904 RepID=A0A097KMY3_9CHLO|nr:hypothetical chloroplast RF1 [Koliella corcontica]AIT94542.1 hypothetical chloroplast RF1 [Koliella corcontica]